MISAHCRVCDAETDLPRGTSWDAICPTCERGEKRIAWSAGDVAVSMAGVARRMMLHPRFIAEAHRPEDVGQRLMTWAENLQGSMLRIMADWQSAYDDMQSRRAQGRRSLLARGAIEACPWCGEPESQLSTRHWCEACEAKACDECGEAPAVDPLTICHTCEARQEQECRDDVDAQSYLRCEDDEHRLADNRERALDMMDQQRREQAGRDAE